MTAHQTRCFSECEESNGQPCAHDKLVIRAFNRRKIAVDQTIPDPFNRLRETHGGVRDHLSALKPFASVSQVDQVVFRETSNTKLG
jgi:hypothetical protein